MTIADRARTLVFAICLPSLVAPALVATATPAATPTTTPAPRAFFEANLGQRPAPVRFVYRDGRRTTLLSPTEAVIDTGAGAMVRMRLGGGDPTARSEGRELRSGTSNYFVGNDPARWITNVPQFGRVRFQAVYPGIDVEYYPAKDGLEYDFVLAPGADPGRVAMEFPGARVAIDGDGGLVLSGDGEPVRQRRPVAFQVADGRRRDVACAYEMDPNGSVGLRLGAYDRSRPLVVDPVIEYATFLGGSSGDVASAVAVDGSGAIYVAGYANSGDYPTTAGSLKPVTTRDNYVVTKLSSTGQVVYSTYLGGELSPLAGETFGLAVNAAGEAYVAGLTAAADFPTTDGAFQRTLEGDSDAFVARLSADGRRLIYSTLLGGDKGVVPTEQQGDDAITAIAVDASGAAYVTGHTVSFGFPTTPGAIARERVGEGGCEGCDWVFAAKIAPDGGSLVYSTYIGGIAVQIARDIAVDAAGSAYIVGSASSPDFPTTAGAFQPTIAEAGEDFIDAFVLKLNATGTGIVYGTFLGGGGRDVAFSVALDAAGNAYVTGTTTSLNFPVTAGAIQGSHNGSGDAFVAKLSADGSSLGYATYLGGSNYDAGRAIVVRGDEAYIAGETLSPDFRTADAVQARFGGPAGGENAGDAFAARLSSSGTTLVFSTYLGGAQGDRARGLAVDAQGRMVIVGDSFSVDFPTRPDAQPAQPSNGGGSDLFVAVVGAASVTPPAITSASPKGTDSKFVVKLTGTNFQSGARVYIGGDTTPWPTVKQKGTTKITLKKGATLQARFPAGVAVPVRVVNANGGVASTTVTRP